MTAASDTTRNAQPPATTAQGPGTTAYIALGSNLGNRRATLESAIRRLDALSGVRVLRRSSFHETQAVGGPPDQPNYLNGVVRVESAISPTDLLAALLCIEADHGRARGVPDGPRTLDLDLLLFGDVRSDNPELTLPHPRMWGRDFVLDPLAEVCDLPALRRKHGPTSENPQ